MGAEEDVHHVLALREVAHPQLDFVAALFDLTLGLVEHSARCVQHANFHLARIRRIKGHQGLTG